MAKSKRRRRVVWKPVDDVAHCWIIGSMTCLCEAFKLTDAGAREGEEECPECRIILDRLG